MEEPRPAAHPADPLLGVVGAAADTLVAGQAEITRSVTQLMQEVVEHVSTSFEAIAQARTPLEMGQRYMRFLMTVSQRNIRQMGEFGQLMARQQASLLDPLTNAKGSDEGRSPHEEAVRAAQATIGLSG